MNKVFSLVILLMLAVIFAVPSNASVEKGIKGWFGAKASGFHGMKILKAVGLTDQQRNDIEAKGLDLEKEILPLRQSVRKIKMELDAELSADKPDTTKINRIIDNISNKTSEIQKKRTAFIIWIKSQLTQEQKLKFQSVLQEKHENKTQTDK